MIDGHEELNLENLPELTLPYERDLFLWLNNHHSDFWDTFMAIYSGKALWVPVCIALLFVSFYKTKWQQAILFALCFSLVILLCDQISASVIKPFFARLRPTHHPDFMHNVLIVDNYRGGRFGFISAHASNGFGVATFLSLIYKQRKLTVALFTWASISCYSRIYLGVHFITDIIGGAILGALFGFLVYLMFQYLRVKIFGADVKNLDTPLYGRKQANILIAVLLLTVLFNVIYSLVVNY